MFGGGLVPSRVPRSSGRRRVERGLGRQRETVGDSGGRQEKGREGPGRGPSRGGRCRGPGRGRRPVLPSATVATAKVPPRGAPGRPIELLGGGPIGEVTPPPAKKGGGKRKWWHERRQQRSFPPVSAPTYHRTPMHPRPHFQPPRNQRPRKRHLNPGTNESPLAL